MKIVITGKNGLLSSSLRSLDSSLVALSKEDYDICDVSIIDKLDNINPDIIIHAGAVTDNRFIDENRELAIQTNIVGTAHISSYSIRKNKRLVYISTDYVYDGDNDLPHKESESVFPYNNYAWTKLGGECSVRLVPNHAIIRTSFGSSTFPYKKAFDNMMVSKDYVDIIAPKILNVTLSSFVGVINVGTEPKSVYDYASRRNNVEKDSLPHDKNFSLDLKVYDTTLTY